MSARKRPENLRSHRWIGVNDLRSFGHRSRLRQGGYQLVVAEFNYQREFRDRTSALESILATVQGSGGATVIVFFNPIDEEPLTRLRARFPDFIAVPLPVSRETMDVTLNSLTEKP